MLWARQKDRQNYFQSQTASFLVGLTCQGKEGKKIHVRAKNKRSKPKVFKLEDVVFIYFSSRCCSIPCCCCCFIYLLAPLFYFHKFWTRCERSAGTFHSTFSFDGQECWCFCTNIDSHFFFFLVLQPFFIPRSKKPGYCYRFLLGLFHTLPATERRLLFLFHVYRFDLSFHIYIYRI